MNELDYIKVVDKPAIITTKRFYIFEINRDRYNRVRISVGFNNGILEDIHYDKEFLTEATDWKIKEIIIEKLKEIKEIEEKNKFKLS